MKISKLILHKILNEPEFSFQISAILGIKQASVEMTARRSLNRGTLPISLLRDEVISFLKEYGFTQNQIFEN